jgi:hypothetical protein
MAIIGILAAIVLPAYNEVKLAAKKAKDVSNLKKIAEAWRECFINRGWELNSWNVILGAGNFVRILAGSSKSNISDMVLNDPYVYISPGDKYASKVQRETITYLHEGETISYYSDTFSERNIQETPHSER